MKVVTKYNINTENFSFLSKSKNNSQKTRINTGPWVPTNQDRRKQWRNGANPFGTTTLSRLSKRDRKIRSSGVLTREEKRGSSLDILHLYPKRRVKATKYNIPY